MADMGSTSELREQVAALQAENQKLHTINQALMYRVEEGGEILTLHILYLNTLSNSHYTLT